MLFAVDPVAAVVDEATAWGADLVVTHHPLLLRPVHSIAATTFKGALLHRLVRAGIALYTAHTNADAAAGGVNDALAAALGLVGTVPLDPAPAEALDKHVVFVPVADAERLVDALAAAGAGAIGEYTRCAWTSTGEGTFTPVRRGVARRSGPPGRRRAWSRRASRWWRRAGCASAVVAAMRAAHPYEEPAFDVLELASWPGADRHRPRRDAGGADDAARVRGHRRRRAARDRAGRAVRGRPRRSRRARRRRRRVGRLVLRRRPRVGRRRLRDRRPAPPPRVRAARARGARGLVRTPYLVDVAHFASEWPWLAHAARALEQDAAAAGTTVETRVSTVSTDPWTGRVASPEPPEALHPTAPPEGHP